MVRYVGTKGLANSHRAVSRSDLTHLYPEERACEMGLIIDESIIQVDPNLFPPFSQPSDRGIFRFHRAESSIKQRAQLAEIFQAFQRTLVSILSGNTQLWLGLFTSRFIRPANAHDPRDFVARSANGRVVYE